MPNEEWNAHDALELVADRLQSLADPERARDMAAYMKGKGEFFGVPKPATNPVYKELIAGYPVASDGQYESLVGALWGMPEREPKYLAIRVAGRWHQFHTMRHLSLYERMVVEGAWWDLVDEIASNLVGDVVRSEPDGAWPHMDDWIGSPDLWLRRTAILCQLRSKEATDEERLFRYCSERAHEREFFIRKAIGWALRAYAGTNPTAVIGFLRTHRDELSGLSFREAAKHLGAV